MHTSLAQRYLAEFDFRYNEPSALGVNDAQRMAKSVNGIVGKRLTYRRTRLGTHSNPLTYDGGECES